MSCIILQFPTQLAQSNIMFDLINGTSKGISCEFQYLCQFRHVIEMGKAIGLFKVHLSEAYLEKMQASLQFNSSRDLENVVVLSFGQCEYLTLSGKP